MFRELKLVSENMMLSKLVDNSMPEINVTIDNFLTSQSLVTKLKAIQMTVINTLPTSWKEILKYVH